MAGAHVSGSAQSNGISADLDPWRTVTPSASSRCTTLRPVLPVLPMTRTGLVSDEWVMPTIQRLSVETSHSSKAQFHTRSSPIHPRLRRASVAQPAVEFDRSRRTDVHDRIRRTETRHGAIRVTGRIRGTPVWNRTYNGRRWTTAGFLRPNPAAIRPGATAPRGVAVRTKGCDCGRIACRPDRRQRDGRSNRTRALGLARAIVVIAAPGRSNALVFVVSIEQCYAGAPDPALIDRIAATLRPY